MYGSSSHSYEQAKLAVFPHQAYTQHKIQIPSAVGQAAAKVYNMHTTYNTYCWSIARFITLPLYIPKNYSDNVVNIQRVRKLQQQQPLCCYQCLHEPPLLPCIWLRLFVSLLLCVRCRLGIFGSLSQ